MPCTPQRYQAVRFTYTNRFRESMTPLESLPDEFSFSRRWKASDRAICEMDDRTLELPSRACTRSRRSPCAEKFLGGGK